MSPASPKPERAIEVFESAWQGIAITIHFEVRWLDLESIHIVHLEVRSASGERLPIAETGYRSHFATTTEITEGGGPVAYAVAWLDYMAQSNEWKAYVEGARQLSLF
ncbi:hypothetical protein [Caulobacter mirabilis]|uniref:Uncharacterized protein n=1 Tax=Caulobacter mirabilis TaxID=69666 RepID=A0A2D2AYM1_9CAUL|nr:hypothetical protein [Caulobacter mirabilis]ATQ43119.1 hypothetical protein CSW64_12190 [Caulobacter mirabilis]